MRSTLDDLVDGAVLSVMADIFVLGFPVVVSKKVLVDNGIDIGMLRGFNRWSGEVRLVSFGIDRERAEKLLGLIERFVDGEGSFDPVD